MQRLKNPQEAAAWFKARVQNGTLQTDSRKIKMGDGFVAWPGAAYDGRQHVPECLAAGAGAVLIEHEGAAEFGFSDDRVASYVGLKAASGLIAAAYFSHPSHALEVIAITGTNGKTSTAWWLAQAINTIRRSQALLKNEQSTQYACGLIGTLGLGTPGQLRPTGLTTPDPVQLQTELARLRDAGASACAIEASSIGMAEHRLAGTRIKVAIFSNFTQDHLDYHGNMNAYWLAKRALFDEPDLQAAVINLDDERGEVLRTHCIGRGLRVISTSQLRRDATLWASPVEYIARGMQFVVHEGADQVTVNCPVVGDYNAANLLGVIGALRALQVNLQDAAHAIAQGTPVPGRMELLGGQMQPLAVVDYAHTPDALTKTLQALRPVTLVRSGKLWCVFGCGGNRDASKRPLMAQAALAADHVVVTSDNPRGEKPEEIAHQIMSGLSLPGKVQLELLRGRAIKGAIAQAQAADVVLLAGKGHEDYQEISGVKHAFSDQQVALAALAVWPEVAA